MGCGQLSRFRRPVPGSCSVRLLDVGGKRYVVTDPEALSQMRVPEGETVVEVPKSLMKYLPPEEAHAEGHG